MWTQCHPGPVLFLPKSVLKNVSTFRAIKGVGSVHLLS